jgi:hypothetical protein
LTAQVRGSRRFEAYTVLELPPGPELTRETSAWIAEGLEAAMPSLNIREYFLAKSSTLSDCDFVIAAVEHDSGRIISALTSRWHQGDAQRSFLHVKILMITPRYQKTRLINDVWAFHLARVCRSRFGFPYVIALRTYNPVVFGAMRIFTRIDGIRLYPAIGVESQDPEMTALAEAIAGQVSPGLAFEVETGVISGAGVPPDFYPAMPESRKADVHQYFARHLAPSDRMLCVLSVETEAAREKALQLFGVRLEAGAAAPSSSGSAGN